MFEGLLLLVAACAVFGALCGLLLGLVNGGDAREFFDSFKGGFLFGAGFALCVVVVACCLLGLGVGLAMVFGG